MMDWKEVHVHVHVQHVEAQIFHVWVQTKNGGRWTMQGFTLTFIRWGGGNSDISWN